MTTIQHVSAKEMTRRTGVRNALGYTFPKKNMILLRKGLTGKRKRQVLDHEIEHLEKGEEGPFIDPGTATLIGAGISGVSGLLGSKGGEAAAAVQREMFNRVMSQLGPYREFGGAELENLRNWLAGPTGAFSEISPEDVVASPEYQTALTTMQNTLASRGGLQSGNALRRVVEELAPAGVQSERQRRYQELAQRLGLVNIGQQAAAGGAGAATQFAPGMAVTAAAPYEAWQGAAGDIAGFLGQYAGQRQWQDFLEQYKNPAINSYASP